MENIVALTTNTISKTRIIVYDVEEIRILFKKNVGFYFDKIQVIGTIEDRQVILCNSSQSYLALLSRANLAESHLIC
ncbi:MAG: hypothetical protein M0Q38_01385 [Bacteroidales bacterium]|jgi:hypothetical protein|nr:hypothetical protein [Bacteroidales bacterium]